MDINRSNLIEKNKSYYFYLKKATEKNDDFEDILKYLPDFYKILCNIVGDDKSNWYTKMLANAAISYLVIEEDIISDKKNDGGYMDDLFICAAVLKKIRDNISKTIILTNLDGVRYKADILNIIYDVYSQSSISLGTKTDEILDLVGLNEFNKFDFNYEKEKSIRLNIAKNKNKLLYAMLAVKTREIFYEMNRSYSQESIREYIKNVPESAEIERYKSFLG